MIHLPATACLAAACLAAACLAALAAAVPAHARDLTGTVVIRERLALAEGTQVLIEILSPEGRAASTAAPLAGQPPSGFALQVPDTALLAIAALRTPDGRTWVAPPAQVAPGSGAVSVGDLVATRFDEGGFAATLACGAAVFRLGYTGNVAHLTRGGQTLRLPEVPAASGVKHEEGETSVHTKGDRALIVWQGEAMPECRPFLWPDAQEVTARGNEPGWVMTVGPEGARLSMQDGTGLQAQAQVTMLGDDAVLVMAPGLPDLTLAPGICSDSMTGMPYPARASLGTAGTEEGCAGNPLDLLSGAWTVAGIDGTALPGDAGVTMDFAEGRLAGASGCNRYTAQVTLTGEALTFGPAAGTMMACAPTLMERERAFLDALAAVDRFEIDGEGALLLIGGDRVRLRAIR